MSTVDVQTRLFACMEVDLQSLFPVEAFRSIVTQHTGLHKTVLLDHRAARSNVGKDLSSYLSRSNTARLVGLKNVSLEHSHFELIPPPDL